MKFNNFIIYLGFILINLSIFCSNAIAQEQEKAGEQEDATQLNSNLENKIIKNTTPKDTIPDSSKIETKSISQLKAASDKLDAPIEYNAKDSIVYDVNSGMLYLYGNARVTQEKTTLSAARLILDQNNRTVDAKSITDSTGEMIGRPLFMDKGKEFRADELSYNFDSKKGKISQLVTQEGDGFLVSEKVKKNQYDELFAQNAYYTTCDLEHPHFKIAVSKVKVVPQKLIVSGPAQLFIADVPTPLVLPFGIFPLQKGQRSGVLIPAYGYSPNQGFYLRGGGFYFGASDYFDIALTGDVTTNGSWRAELGTRYSQRYRYNGRVNLNFASTQIGDPIVETSGRQQDFRVEWRHNQDPKARPYSTFLANVNFGTSSFNREYDATNTDVLTNTLNSGISYTQNFPNAPLSLTVAARHNQQLNTNIVNITGPDINLTMARQFPFKNRNKKVAKELWYEKIGISSSINSRAEISAADSLLFEKETLDDIGFGIQHIARIGTNLNILKYLKLTPSVSYEGLGYFESTKRIWITDTTFSATDTIAPHVETITENGFRAGAEFSGTATLSTRFFGIFNFKKGRIKAIRHEMTPNITFNYRPDFGQESWGYYRPIVDENDQLITDPTLRQTIGSDTLYNSFSGIYGGISSSQQSTVTFSLNNNLQAKLFPKKKKKGEKRDTSDSDKDQKIKLLDRLNFSTSHNFAAEEYKWGNLRVNAGTSIFNKLNFSYSSSFDPYILDENGTRQPTLEWTENKKLAHLSNMSITLNTNIKATDFQGNKKKKATKTSKGTAQEREAALRDRRRGAMLDNQLPWRLGIDYTMSLNRDRADGDYFNTVTQTLNFNGELNLTPKWKLTLNSGYDFTNKEFARTTFNLYRDLHCWEMNFFIAPLGAFRRYEFSLRVKSSVLQDLKLTRKRYWRDL